MLETVLVCILGLVLFGPQLKAKQGKGELL